MSLFLDPKLVPVSEPMPNNPQEIVDLVSEYTGIGGLGGFSGINVGSGTPPVADQDKPWFKVDNDGNALGWWYFVGGIWRPERPIGTIMHFGYNITSAPVGWRLCDGNGTFFDEANVEHDIPDYRDRVVVGAGNDYNFGDTGGANSYSISVALPSETGEVSLGIDNMPPHRHDYATGYVSNPLTGSDTIRTGEFGGGTADDAIHVYETSQKGSGAPFTMPLGGSATGSTDVRQPYVGAPSIIWIATA